MTNPKTSKQLTLDTLPDDTQSEAPKAPRKSIVITGIDTLTKEDELTLNVGFKLIPSKASFSKIQMDLWFDNQQINSYAVRILQGALSADELELPFVLDMKGVPAGAHQIKVEMYELWVSDERFSQTSKEITVDYVPQIRESRYVRVPTVKSAPGADLAVISEMEKDVYREMEKTVKKEQISKRDDW
jgi:hypothetical protein